MNQAVTRERHKMSCRAVLGRSQASSDTAPLCQVTSSAAARHVDVMRLGRGDYVQLGRWADKVRSA